MPMAVCNFLRQGSHLQEWPPSKRQLTTKEDQVALRPNWDEWNSENPGMIAADHFRGATRTRLLELRRVTDMPFSASLRGKTDGKYIRTRWQTATLADQTAEELQTQHL